MAGNEPKGNKLKISAEITLPPGDYFSTADRAGKARGVLEKAGAEIAKDFPGFTFSTDVVPIRAHGGGRPKTGAAAAGEPAAAAAAAAGNGAGSSATAPAAGSGGAPAVVGQQRPAGQAAG